MTENDLITIQPLGELLGEALDGGEIINGDLWHPHRKPLFHKPNAVERLRDRITAEWKPISDTANGEEPYDYCTYFGPEIDKLLSIFGHAIDSDECIVSILEPAVDKERAERVSSFPFKYSDDTKAIRSIFSHWLAIGGIVAFGLTVCAWRYRRFLLKRNSRHTASVDVQSDEFQSEHSTQENVRKTNG